MRRRTFDNYVRLPFEKLPTLIPILKKKRIAKNLKDDKAVLMANLYECLLDPDHTLPDRKYKIFTLLEDMGVRMLQIGTKGGGYYGPYRRFRVLFRDIELIVGIGMHRFLNRVRSILCVSVQVGEEGKPHHSLQLAVDDYMTIKGRTCTFSHKGHIGLGAIGTGRNAILREKYVKTLYPSIINGDVYILGKLNKRKLWYLSDRSMAKFVENLISYAIVRDLYREDAKKAAGLVN
ncbi:MAG: hypothetical protein IJ862_07360 [Selenomonadaceae bacterium]|nr:hypothetical protein [Selenomonadaceae bacterium]